jgi:UDP-N-acetylmuramate--alanine ligase
VRLIDLDHADGCSRFSIVFRDRAGAIMHEIDVSLCPCRGATMLSMPRPRLRCARLGVGGDLILALAEFGGVRRRFTRTGEWNGVPIIDDYGHHPVEIAPCCGPQGKRARAG